MTIVRRALPLLLAATILALPVAAAPRRLSGRVEGVLTLPGEYTWGAHYEPGFSWEWAREDQKSPHRAYRFLVDGSHYVADVTPSQAEHVRGPVRLVELAIENEARPRGSHLKVSSVRVLDGTDEIPWRMEDQLSALRARFDGAIQQNRRALNARRQEARTHLLEHLPGKVLHDLETNEVVIYEPTWHADTRQLEVFFGYKQQGGFWIRSKPRSGNPHVKGPPTPRERGVSYIAAMGARYVVDAGGRVVDQQIFEPRTGAGYQSVPWHPKQRVETVDRTPNPRPRGLRYFTTCGDPVCSKTGYRGPFPNVPLCGKRKEGDGCSKRGETCDLANNCNMFLVCTDIDPSTRCAR